MAKHIDNVINNLKKASQISSQGNRGDWSGFSDALRAARIEMELLIEERTSCPK